MIYVVTYKGIVYTTFDHDTGDNKRRALSLRDRMRKDGRVPAEVLEVDLSKAEKLP